LYRATCARGESGPLRRNYHFPGDSLDTEESWESFKVPGLGPRVCCFPGHRVTWGSEEGTAAAALNNGTAVIFHRERARADGGGALSSEFKRVAGELLAGRWRFSVTTTRKQLPRAPRIE